jgi:hypothetical protein
VRPASWLVTDCWRGLLLCRPLARFETLSLTHCLASQFQRCVNRPVSSARRCHIALRAVGERNDYGVGVTATRVLP